MTPWSQLLVNPEALSMYDTAPSLETARCLSVLVEPDFSAIELTLGLNGFPEHPPAGWGKAADAVMLTLQLMGVQNFSVVGKLAEANQPALACTLTQSEREAALDFLCVFPHLAICAKCQSVRVAHIGGYTRLPEGSLAN